MQQCIELLQAGDGAVVIFTLGKTAGHGFAHGMPVLRRDQARNTTVGHDLDLMIGQFDVNQYAAVFFRIPDPVLRKQFMRALTRADAGPYCG